MMIRFPARFILLLSCWMASSIATTLQAQTPADPSAVVATQQGQSKDLAKTWLYSSDPRAVAWGAFVARRDKHEDLVADLIDLAGRYHLWSVPPSDFEVDGHNAMQQVLDAIIQMNHTVTPDIAANLYSEFPVESLIFLSRAGTQATPFLLDIFQHGQNDTAWLAAGNLLLERRPAGFAASVLSGLSVNAVVYVIDSAGLGGSIGSGLSSCGDAFAPPPRPGWPAAIYYYFATKATPGRVVLSDGPSPVYYVRIEASIGNPGGFGDCGRPSNEIRCVPVSWRASLEYQRTTRSFGSPLRQW